MKKLRILLVLLAACFATMQTKAQRTMHSDSLVAIDFSVEDDSAATLSFLTPIRSYDVCVFFLNSVKSEAYLSIGQIGYRDSSVWPGYIVYQKTARSTSIDSAVSFLIKSLPDQSHGEEGILETNINNVIVAKNGMRNYVVNIYWLPGKHSWVIEPQMLDQQRRYYNPVKLFII